MDVARVQALLKLKQLKTLKVDVKGFKKELLLDKDFPSHQAIGIAYLTVGEQVGIFSPVGSGKTVMSIGADLKLRELNKHHKTLVGCLSNTAEQWYEEYKKWTDLSVCLISGQKADRYRNWLTANNCDVAIASYDAIRADKDIVLGLRFDLAIWDEASYFKNPETKISEVLEEIRDYFPYRFILTATPLQKCLEDVYSIFKKMDPTIIPMDLDQFRENFEIRELIRTRGKRGRPMSFWKITGYKNHLDLAQMIYPRFLKHERSEIFGDKLKRTPPMMRRVELTTVQREKYDKIRELVQLPTDDSAKLSMLQAFSQMEHCCDSMNYFDESLHDSAKLDDLMFMLQNDLQDEKVVVFAKYHAILNEFCRRMQEAHIEYVRVTGKESAEIDPNLGTSQRHRNVKQFFEKASTQVCIITTTGEMGLNLHVAHYMVFLNHVYNPAREEQIFGRIDRPMVSKHESVTAIHYVAKNTIEDALLKKMERERELCESIFGAGHATLLHAMSAQQLYNLLKFNEVVLPKAQPKQTANVIQG